MKQTPLTLHALGAVALLATMPAHAIKHGIQPSTAPGAPAIVNPFTGQATDVWKLVGYNNTGCSGFQITREWVANSRHCGSNPASTNPFRNHLGQSTLATCESHPDADFQICRLSNPAALQAMPSYPPLGVAPGYGVATSITAAKHGSIMAYGRSGLGDGLAFTGFDGLPLGFNPVLAPNTPPIPFGVGGDSGGAAYWFPPGASTPVLMGVVVSGTTVNATALRFTLDHVNWISQRITAYGDPAPVIRAAEQLYTPPAGNEPPPLSTPPAFKTTGPGTGSLTWLTPSANPVVSSFDIQLGRNGAIERSLSQGTGSSNVLAINNLANDRYIACVRARNAIGAATAAATQMNYPMADSATWFSTYTTPNCTTLDNRLTQASVTGMTSSVTPVPGTRSLRVAITWPAATPVPADLPIAQYRLSTETTYPTGPKRAATTDTTARSVAVTVPAGSKVCASVTPITAMGQRGATTSAYCVTAN